VHDKLSPESPEAKTLWLVMDIDGWSWEVESITSLRKYTQLLCQRPLVGSCPHGQPEWFPLRHLYKYWVWRAIPTSSTGLHLMSFLFLLLSLFPTFISSNALVAQQNPVTLELLRFVNETGMRNLVAHDQARAKALRNRQGTASNVEPIINQVVCYTASVGVGSPPTFCMLISILPADTDHHL
jgi:hypothetical protein